MTLTEGPEAPAVQRRDANRARYANVNELWKATPVPAITALEAERAAKRIFRKFGRKTGYPLQRSDAKLRYPARRVWISSKPMANADSDRGWSRLVHDVSHDIFRKRYPNLRPHNPLHAKLEHEIAEYVVASGWLSGSLLPKPRPPGAVFADKLARVDAAITRWDSKLRRAQTALTKLRRRRAAFISARARSWS